MFIAKRRILDNLPSQRDGMFIAKSRIPGNLPSQRDGMFIATASSTIFHHSVMACL